MLIDFFYTLRSAKLPVSVKEYLTLLEALQANVVGPNSDASSMDDFYHLSRMILVKDEKHFDKFDKAFGAYFKGVEMLTASNLEEAEVWVPWRSQGGVAARGVGDGNQRIARAMQYDHRALTGLATDVQFVGATPDLRRQGA